MNVTAIVEHNTQGSRIAPVHTQINLIFGNNFCRFKQAQTQALSCVTLAPEILADKVTDMPCTFNQ